MSWATDPLAEGMLLAGRGGFSLARLNQRANRDNRVAQSTTVSGNLTAAATAITVASATGFPAESVDFYAQLDQATPPDWVGSTNYASGDIVKPTATKLNGRYYIVTTDAGSSGGTEPTWPLSGTVVDGGITWTAYIPVSEVVKCTARTGTACTVSRHARGLATGGSRTAVAVAAASVPFYTGSAFKVLGRYIDLTAAAALSTVTLATSSNSDDIVDTASAHGMVAGQRFRFTALTGGSNVVANRTYYVIAANLAAQTFQFATTSGGTAVNFGSDITAGTVQPFAVVPANDPDTLGEMLNTYFGIAKVYGQWVYEIASRYAYRALTLTVVE